MVLFPSYLVYANSSRNFSHQHKETRSYAICHTLTPNQNILRSLVRNRSIPRRYFALYYFFVFVILENESRLKSKLQWYLEQITARISEWTLWKPGESYPTLSTQISHTLEPIKERSGKRIRPSDDSVM